MKIVQNALFRSCAALFGQIAFFSVKVLKIVTLAWNSGQNGKTVHFPWKLYKNALFRSCAALFGQIKVFQIVKLASNFLQSGKNSALFMKIVQHALFRSCASVKFWPNLFWAQSSQNRETALKFLQNGKTVRFPWKLYKTLFSGHAQHFGKSHFGAGSQNHEILSKTRKQCAFHENCARRKVFRSCAFLQNRKTVRFPRKLYKTRFSGHARHVLAKSDFWALKVLKILKLASNFRQN